MPRLFSKNGTPDRKAGSQNYRSKGRATRLRPTTAGLPGGLMRIVRQLVCQGIFLVASLNSNGVLANPEDLAAEGPRWACWYAPASLTITCRLSRVPDASLEMRTADPGSQIDRSLPALVRSMWANPEKLAGANITIPLMTVPYEMGLVKTLAKAVMCGSRKDCFVSFDPNRDGLAPVRAAALEAGASEAEVMAEVMRQGLDRVGTQANAESATPRMAKRRRGAL